MSYSTLKYAPKENRDQNPHSYLVFLWGRLVGYKLWMPVWQRGILFWWRCIQLATQIMFFSKFGYHNLCMLITCWQQIEECCLFKWLCISSSFQFNWPLDFEQCSMVVTIISTKEVSWLLNVKHHWSTLYLIITNISPCTTKDTHWTRIQNLHP